MLCREQTVSATHNREMIAHALRCKSWKCEWCAEDNKKRVIALAIAGEPTTLLTLTTNPNRDPDPDRASHELLQAFQKLIRTLRKHYASTRIEYLYLWEQTKRGMPHLHVLLRAPFIPQHQISTFMNEAIDAPIVDIRAVKSNRAIANYVAKYLSKDPHQFANHNRYRYSHRWLDTETTRQRPLAYSHNWHYTRVPSPIWLFAKYMSFDYRILWCGETIHGIKRAWKPPDYRPEWTTARDYL